MVAGAPGSCSYRFRSLQQRVPCDSFVLGSTRPRKGAPNRHPVSAHLSFIGVTCGSRNDPKTAASPKASPALSTVQQLAGAGKLEHSLHRPQARQQIGVCLSRWLRCSEPL